MQTATQQPDLMLEAAFEALEQGIPFSSLKTRLVQYHGTNPDRKLHKLINKMVMEAIEADLARA